MRRNITRWALVLLASLELLTAFSMPASALQASFTASPTQGPAPLTVTFEPSVSGGIQPYHYSWVFGDGQVSSDRTPIHTFSAAGSYTVTLTVTCSCQPPTSVYYSQTIVVSGSSSLPNSSFSFNPSGGTAPLNVSFVPIASGYLYNYQWDFGDGDTSNEARPTHLFETPGDYAVILTVSSGDPSSANSSRQTIPVLPALQVRVSAEAGIGAASLQVNFSSSVAGSTSSYSYLWDFGDGSSSSEVNASHIYDAPGSYPVQLKITDITSGQTVSRDLTVQVGTQPQTGWGVYSAIVLIVPIVLGIAIIGLWLRRKKG